MHAGQVAALARRPDSGDGDAARWVTLGQAAQRAPRVPGMLSRLVDAWEVVAAHAGPTPVRCPGLGVGIATVRVDGADMPCVGKDDIPGMLCALAGRAPPADGRDSAWLCPAEAARRLGTRLTPRLVEVWHDVTVAALAGPSPRIAPGSGLKVGLRSIRGEMRPCVHAVSLPELREAVHRPFEPPRADDGWVPLAGLADDLRMDNAGLRARRDLVALGRRHAAEGYATFDGMPLPIVRRLSADGTPEADLSPSEADSLRRILSPGARRAGRP
jgi:hypothetical protein